MENSAADQRDVIRSATDDRHVARCQTPFFIYGSSFHMAAWLTGFDTAPLARFP
jgi:hypothetical protein